MVETLQRFTKLMNNFISLSISIPVTPTPPGTHMLPILSLRTVSIFSLKSEKIETIEYRISRLKESGRWGINSISYFSPDNLNQ